MKLFKITLIILVLVAFASCKDAQEPETHGYVVAIGIDMPEPTEKGYIITLQFANPDKISGGSSESGGSGGEESIENISVLAPGIYPAINIANHIISKRFILAHTKLVVFSESVAGQGIGEFLETINRSGEIRPNIYFAVSKGSAKEFLEAVNPKTEVNPVRYYTMIFENDYSGFIPQNMSRDFYLFYQTDEKSAVMPICSVSNGEGGNSYSASDYQYELENYTAGEIPTSSGEIQIAGMAVFDRGKKLAEMGEIETEIFNILTGEYQSSYVSYKLADSDEPITVFEQQKRRPKISVDTSSKTPKIAITLYLEGELASDSPSYPAENSLGELSAAAAAAIKNQAEEFLTKTTSIGADVVGFGSYARRSFADIDAFAAYDWRCAYKNAQFDIDVRFSVRRTGLVVRSDR